jgi:hypothetical protein
VSFDETQAQFPAAKLFIAICDERLKLLLLRMEESQQRIAIQQI